LHGWLRERELVAPAVAWWISQGGVQCCGKNLPSGGARDAGFLTKQLLGFSEQRGLSIIVARLTLWLNAQEAPAFTAWSALDEH